MKLARWGTIFWGAAVTVIALAVGRIGTSIIDIMGTIYGYFTGPLVAVFLLGIYSKRANGRGALLGLLAGFVTVSCVAKFTDVFWLWYGFSGLVSTLLAVWCISLVTGEPPTAKQLAAARPDDEAAPDMQAPQIEKTESPN